MRGPPTTRTVRISTQMADTIVFKRDEKRYPNTPHLVHPDIWEFLEGAWERTDEEFDPSIEQPDGSLWMREGANDPWVYHSGKWAAVGSSGRILGFISWPGVRADPVQWFRMRSCAEQRVTAPPPSLQPSPWNARCDRCGKGIYQGLFKIEHEGGGCVP